jgi:hypothetical protein
MSLFTLLPLWPTPVTGAPPSPGSRVWVFSFSKQNAVRYQALESLSGMSQVEITAPNLENAPPLWSGSGILRKPIVQVSKGGRAPRTLLKNERVNDGINYCFYSAQQTAWIGYLLEEGSELRAYLLNENGMLFYVPLWSWLLEGNVNLIERSFDGKSFAFLSFKFKDGTGALYVVDIDEKNYQLLDTQFHKLNESKVPKNEIIDERNGEVTLPGLKEKINLHYVGKERGLPLPYRKTAKYSCPVAGGLIMKLQAHYRPGVMLYRDRNNLEFTFPADFFLEWGEEHCVNALSALEEALDRRYPNGYVWISHGIEKERELFMLIPIPGDADDFSALRINRGGSFEVYAKPWDPKGHKTTFNTNSLSKDMLKSFQEAACRQAISP